MRLFTIYFCISLFFLSFLGCGAKKEMEDYYSYLRVEEVEGLFKVEEVRNTGVPELALVLVKGKIKDGNKMVEAQFNLVVARQHMVNSGAILPEKRVKLSRVYYYSTPTHQTFFWTITSVVQSEELKGAWNWNKERSTWDWTL